MKKRLEAELISIAHRVLKLKNKSEVDQLYFESQKLYETISLLKFYNDNFEQIKNEVSIEEIEEKIENSLDKKIEPQLVTFEKEVEKVEEITAAQENIVAQNNETEEQTNPEDEVVTETNNSENLAEEFVEEVKSEIDFAPIFELASEAPIEIEESTQIEPIKADTKQISFEDFLGENYKEPEFVKPDEVTVSTKKSKKEIKVETSVENTIQVEEKPISLNDRLAKSINIGLNDRVGFVKHLFNESTEDFNRVISQLNTFSTFEEAKDFVEEIIKPDYNNWEGKEDYAERFLNFVEQKFV